MSELQLNTDQVIIEKYVVSWDTSGYDEITTADFDSLEEALGFINRSAMSPDCNDLRLFREIPISIEVNTKVL